ncbi:hypothetical protein FHW88_000955 [Mucilaginibacter sp. SG538B]|uniref:XAC2610-related protein n=1 Tax=Mucilaginibacter sp. SG538B TaxID=2587021 RepID=UPI00159E649C|nr:hypothetical protein [Mucilaginibacter sp. SG538B]NVM62679.1 hypothetical protein [Mucilaginibacter sp. SG538B]
MKAFLIVLVLLIGTNCLFAQEDTYQTVTARVDDVLYKAIYKSSDRSISILKPNGKTMLHLNSGDCYEEGFSSFKFVDFNGDGYKDLFIEHMSNVAGRCDLLLYDKLKKKFVLIKDFPDYPVPERLKNTNLYYSYHRSGCADSNWDSDLFKIINNKIIKIGNISGLDCGDKEIGVFITKVRGAKEQLIKKYPISEIGKYKNYKWGFIEQYWKRNYRKFI